MTLKRLTYNEQRRRSYTHKWLLSLPVGVWRNWRGVLVTPFSCTKPFWKFLLWTAFRTPSHFMEGKQWHDFTAACGFAPCEDMYAYIHKHARSRRTGCFLSWTCLENPHLSPTSHHPYRVLPSLATGGWLVVKGGKLILIFCLCQT